VYHKCAEALASHFTDAARKRELPTVAIHREIYPNQVPGQASNGKTKSRVHTTKKCCFGGPAASASSAADAKGAAGISASTRDDHQAATQVPCPQVHEVHACQVPRHPGGCELSADALAGPSS